METATLFLIPRAQNNLWYEIITNVKINWGKYLVSVLT